MFNRDLVWSISSSVILFILTSWYTFMVFACVFNFWIYKTESDFTFHLWLVIYLFLCFFPSNSWLLVWFSVWCISSFFGRVQQESVDDAERNHFLVNYVDYAFDDFGGRQPPVYPGLSTVWGSLARSKVSLSHWLLSFTNC